MQHRIVIIIYHKREEETHVDVLCYDAQAC